MTHRWIDHVVEDGESREYLMEECCDRGHQPVRLQRILRTTKAEYEEWTAFKEQKHAQFKRHLFLACFSGPLSGLAIMLTGYVLCSHGMYGLSEAQWVWITVPATFSVGIVLASFFFWRFYRHMQTSSGFVHEKEKVFLQRYGLAPRADRGDVATQPGTDCMFLLMYLEQPI